MKVDYYVKQINEKKETKNLFLFTDDLQIIKTFDVVEFDSLFFQVIELEVVKNLHIKAICVETTVKLIKLIKEDEEDQE